MNVIVREKRNGHRLSPEQVYRLRCAALTGVSHGLLAAVYGVSQSTATRAINGDTHASVPHPVEAPQEEDWGGGPRFLAFREAVEWLMSASPDEIEVLRVERPARRAPASSMLKVLDMVEGERAKVGLSGLEADSRARAAKRSRDRREYLRELLTDALGDE